MAIVIFVGAHTNSMLSRKTLTRKTKALAMMLSYNIRLSSTSNASYSKFPKIMVAIDGSEHSLKAAEYALEIAKSFNSQLFAITVTSVPESYRLRQEDILEESREMADSRAWLEIFSHKANRQYRIENRTN